MKVCCVFSWESPHRDDSNEYTQYTGSNIKKKITLNYPKIAVMWLFSRGFMNELEIAVINEPSVSESLKFYCTLFEAIPKFHLNVDRYINRVAYSKRDRSNVH